MPATDKAGGGVFTSVRSIWAVLISVFYTRLTLASTELEEERERLELLVVSGIAAAALFGMSIFFSAFFLVVLFWEDRVPVLGSIAAVLIVSSLVMVYRVYLLVAGRPKFMEGTLKELRRDLEGLRQLQPDHGEEEKKRG